MEMNNTTQSKDRLTPKKKLKVLMNKTEECKVIATNAREVAPTGFETI